MKQVTRCKKDKVVNKNHAFLNWLSTYTTVLLTLISPTRCCWCGTSSPCLSHIILLPWVLGRHLERLLGYLLRRWGLGWILRRTWGRQRGGVLRGKWSCRGLHLLLGRDNWRLRSWHRVRLLWCVRILVVAVVLTLSFFWSGFTI